MFHIYGIAVIFCFQLWGNSVTRKKTKRLDKDKIKKQLIESLTISNAVEIEELNEQVERVEKPEDAANIIQEYEQILRMKRRASSWLGFTKGRFLNTLKKGEIPPNGREGEDSQEYNCV